jgi:hypothetical protein
MQYAPNIPMTGLSMHYSNGKAGIFQTIKIMRDIVNTYKINLTIRQAAVSVIYLTPAKDELAEVNALYCNVRDHVRYVRDIAGVETIMTPDITLRAKVGDCDDQSVLLASLLESVGYPTRFIVSGYSDPKRLEHVYLQTFAGGQWIDLDPTESQYMGWAPPDPVVLYAENI